jgi:hypothetical protein
MKTVWRLVDILGQFTGSATGLCVAHLLQQFGATWPWIWPVLFGAGVCFGFGCVEVAAWREARRLARLQERDRGLIRTMWGAF